MDPSMKKGTEEGPFQIDSSTIDGNVEFEHSQYSCILSVQLYSYVTSINTFSTAVFLRHKYQHFQYSCILTSQVSTKVLCPTKLLIIMIILE